MHWHRTRLALTVFLIGVASLAAAPGGLCQPPEAASDQQLSLDELGESIRQTIDLEKESLDRYREELQNIQKEKIHLAAAANAYQIQLSTYGNLLLSPSADMAAIDKAWTEVRSSLAALQAQVGALPPRMEKVTADRINTEQQQNLIERQIEELRKLPAEKGKAGELLRQARQLRDLLSAKKNVLDQLAAAYETRKENLEKTRRSFTELSAKFEQQIGEKRTRQLFERRKSPLSGQAWSSLVEETSRIFEQGKTILHPDFWIREARQLWQGAGLVLLSFAVFLFVAAVLLMRLRRALVPLEAHPIREHLGSWHLLALRLVNGSLLLAGATGFAYLISRIDLFYLSTPSIRLVAHLLFAALLTRWGRLTLSFWSGQSRLTPESANRLRRMIMAVRYFVWAHLLLSWSLGPPAGLLLIGRIGFELWILVWLIAFWRYVDARPPGSPAAANASRLRYLILAGKGVGYTAAGAGLLMDMVGYGALAVHWYLSWGRSLAVLLWWAVFFFMLREWDRYYREKSAAERDELLSDEYPIQWLMIRFGQLLWLITIGIALILAWGGRQVVLASIYQGLGRSLEIGSMSFSFLGLAYAVLVLLLTQAAARLWRWIFQTKFLNRSGMEVGLQDSITTITVYVIWMLGILVALHVFGLNTASLAVAFGALGIGLGFGLQNIFNNFISGIILLFERPIQVGDDVEINGTWATVKKINVRSTVVQTYDNASLIIPNADFVSSQVTNWSFKDKRLRRNIVVGVAYGSDVVRVRDTLLEIARSTPRVLKHPAADVLFADFGDSALIFRLRVWTDIDNMLKVETAIRFEIDRLFRERGIEISFPQRDIHVRSWLPAEKLSVEDKKAGKKKSEAAGKDSEAKEGE